MSNFSRKIKNFQANSLKKHENWPKKWQSTKKWKKREWTAWEWFYRILFVYSLAVTLPHPKSHIRNQVRSARRLEGLDASVGVRAFILQVILFPFFFRCHNHACSSCFFFVFLCVCTTIFISHVLTLCRCVVSSFSWVSLSVNVFDGTFFFFKNKKLDWLTLRIKPKPRAASNPDPMSSSPTYWSLHHVTFASFEYNFLL